MLIFSIVIIFLLSHNLDFWISIFTDIIKHYKKLHGICFLFLLLYNICTLWFHVHILFGCTRSTLRHYLGNSLPYPKFFTSFLQFLTKKYLRVWQGVSIPEPRTFRLDPYSLISKPLDNLRLKRNKFQENLEAARNLVLSLSQKLRILPVLLKDY